MRDTGRILNAPVTRDEMMRMARHNDGIVKVVADIATGSTAAGTRWHSQSRDLLQERGSRPQDCWGAKLDVHTGEILYQSRINREKAGQGGKEDINDPEVREFMKAKIRYYFPDAPEL